MEPQKGRPNITLGIGGIFCLLLMIFIFSQEFTSSPAWTLLDFPNILVHEGGHFIFMWAGLFLHILAGSATQVIIPGLFVIYFYYTSQKEGFWFAVFWTMESAVNVSIYIKDSQAMVLPLLGGDGSIHDWNWLFSHTGLLSFDWLIGGFVYFVGMIGMSCAMLGMGWVIYQKIFMPEVANVVELETVTR